MNKIVDGRARTISLVVLLIVNIIVFSIVVIEPHDEGDRKGTIPDEYAFYAWSEMYMDGKLDIPINELTTHSTAVIVTMPYASPLDVTADSFSNGTDGLEDDIQVAVEFKDNTPVIGALVFISGRERPVITDDDGKAVIENYRLSSGEIIARYEDDSGNFLGSTVFDRRMSGQMNYNTYVTADIRTTSLRELDTSSPVSIFIDVPAGAPVPPPNVRFTVMINGSEAARVPIRTEMEITLDVSPPFNVRVIDDRGQGLRGGILTIDDIALKLDDKGAGTFSSVGEFEISFTLLDMFGDPVEGADIVLDRQLVGITDEKGELVLIMEMSSGTHEVIAHKDGLDVRDLMAVVADKDGEAVLVSHWPPGQSFIIGVFALLSLEWMISLVLLLMGSWAIFRLGEMYHSTRAGIISSLLFVTAGGTVLMAFSRYMGDLSTAVISIFGLYLLIEGLEFTMRSRYVGSGFALLGGLLMAFAVVCRYSTGIVVAAPAIMAIFYMMRGVDPRKRRIEWKKIGKVLFSLIPFAVGFLIIGSMLLAYNDIYFGGPFNSGYQMDRQITVSTGVSEENTTVTDEPSESFLESYFEYSQEDLDNVPRVASLLFFLLAPLLFAFVAVPFTLRIKGKRYLTISLLAWIASIFMIYLSQGWAGGWVGNDARSMEDMRYYLPALPPAAILLGALLAETFEIGPRLKGSWLPGPMKGITVPGIITVVVVSFLMISGMAVGMYGVDQQVERIDGVMIDKQEPPDQSGPPPSGNAPPDGGIPPTIKDIKQEQGPPGGGMEEGDELFSPVELQWTIPLLLLSLAHILICGIYLAWKGPREELFKEE